MLIAFAVFSGGSGDKNVDTVIIKKSNLVQEVSVTGKVKPAQSVELAFERSGKISWVNGAVGDTVRAGQILVRLVGSDVAAQVSQASAGVENIQANISQYEAALTREKAKLDELNLGTRPEEVALTETAVSNAQIALADTQTNLSNIQTKADEDLSNAYGDVLDILNDAYVKANESMYRQLNELFTDESMSVTSRLTFFVNDGQLENDIAWQRPTVLAGLRSWKSELDELSPASTPDVLDAALKNAKTQLLSLRIFLNMVRDAVNKASSSTLPAATLSTYKTNVSTASANVNTAITGITTQEQIITSQKITNQNAISNAQSQVNTTKNTLATAENQLTIKRAGATAEQIAAQEAQIRQAQANIDSQKALLRQSYANVQNYQAQLSKTVIYAPINGIITSQDAKIGEIVTAGKSVVSLISAAKFEMEAGITEADIAKVKIDNAARVTLDAYGSDSIFEAKVTKIDPAETMVDGVATYKTTLQFVSQDPRIKSGMTANIDIVTDTRQGALAAPARAILSEDGSKFVLLLRDPNAADKKTAAVKTQIKIGMRSSDGMVEILEGVTEGDVILIPED